MPEFSYRARNSQGALVEGVLNCPDRAVAIRQIEQLQYIPIRIEAVGGTPQVVTGGAPVVTSAATQNLKIPHTQLLIFTEQLAHLLQAGMTLDEGLNVLQKRLKHPRVQQMTQALHQALVDGRSFSQALRDFPKIFPAIYVNLIAAGEASGALPEILRRLVEHLMQAKNLRDSVQQALIYPAFLAMAGAVLMTIFITYMVPQLTNFMSQNGGTLPLPTRMLVSFNHLLTSYWWVGVLLVVGASVGLRAFVRAEEGRVTWDRIRLSFPGYGRIIKHRYYAQFSRTLGTLVTSGVPILQALNITRETAGNTVIARAISQVHDSVKEGESIVQPLEANGAFPPMVISMIGVGEETGQLPEMLLKIAEVYDDEVDNSVAALTSLLEPIMIVLLALIVGTIVIALFMPLVSIISGLQQQS